MPADECSGCDAFRFAVYGDGVEEFFLLLRDIGQYFAVGGFEQGDDAADSIGCGCGRAGPAFWCVGEGFVECPLHAVGVALEQVVYLSGSFLLYGAVPAAEMSGDKVNIDAALDGSELQHVRTLVEGPGRGGEHFMHEVPLAACKYEFGVAYPLDV